MVSGAGALRSGNTRLPAPGNRLVEAASPGAGLRPSGLGSPARPLPRGQNAATEPGGPAAEQAQRGQRNGGAGVPAARGRAAGGFAGFVLVSGLLPAGRAPRARLGRSRPGMEAPVSTEVRMCSASEVCERFFLKGA